MDGTCHFSLLIETFSCVGVGHATSFDYVVANPPHKENHKNYDPKKSIGVSWSPRANTFVSDTMTGLNHHKTLHFETSLKDWLC